jgi:hypothetical protein
MGEGVTSPNDPRWATMSPGKQSAKMLACYQSEQSHGKFEPGKKAGSRGFSGGPSGFAGVSRK